MHDRICPNGIGIGTCQQGESTAVLVPWAQALVLPSQKGNLNWKISKIASEVVFEIMDLSHVESSEVGNLALVRA